MIDKKTSRRQFIELVTVSLLAFLVSCKTRLTPTVSQTNTPTDIDHTPTSKNTDTPTPTTTATNTPTAIQPPSFRLLTPEDGTFLSAFGKVTFSWEAMQEATLYKLEIIFPSGQSVIFETNSTTRDQYFEAFVMGGKYQWKVTAFDISGIEICSAESFTFEKPEYNPPAQNSGGGDGGNDGGGDGGNDGGGDGGNDGGSDNTSTSSDWSDWSNQ